MQAGINDLKPAYLARLPAWQGRPYNTFYFYTGVKLNTKRRGRFSYIIRMHECNDEFTSIRSYSFLLYIRRSLLLG